MTLRMHGGSDVVAPPEGNIIGPTDGAQWVRDHVGPATVTSPGGGVTFTSASNIQTLVNSNAANTVFVASATGTYTNFRNIDVSGKHPKFYFPGVASAYSITGTASSGFEYALSSGTGGYEVYGGTWRNYASAASPPYSTAFLVRGSSIFRDCHFTANGQKGIGVDNDSNQPASQTYEVTRCSFITNGRYHITSTAAANKWYSISMQYVYFRDANSNHLQGVQGEDSGVMKVLRVDGFMLRYWHAEQNLDGIGSAWCDGYNRNVTWSEGVVENNADGLFYEISNGGTTMEHLFLRNNGSTTSQNIPYSGANIRISNSPADGTGSQGGYAGRSEIRYCEIDSISGYQHGVLLFNDGPAPSGHPVEDRTRNWYVHDNRIWMRGPTSQGVSGLVDTTISTSVKEGDIGTSPNAPGSNLFDYNEWHVANTSGSYWRHDTARQTPGNRDFVGFQSRGHEAHGTLTAI